MVLWVALLCCWSSSSRRSRCPNLECRYQESYQVCRCYRRHLLHMSFGVFSILDVESYKKRQNERLDDMIEL